MLWDARPFVSFAFTSDDVILNQRSIVTLKTYVN